MNQAILMMPKAQVIDSRLQDQASRIQSEIQDSREEIKKQQVKTSYRISIKRFFQKPNNTVLFYKRIFSKFSKLPEWLLSGNRIPVISNRLLVTSLVFKMFSNGLQRSKMISKQCNRLHYISNRLQVNLNVGIQIQLWRVTTFRKIHCIIDYTFVVIDYQWTVLKKKVKSYNS